MSIAPKLVYSPHYDITFFGLERLHPFDSRKYSRAYNLLRRRLPRKLLRQSLLRPKRPIAEQDLLTVHTPQYLTRSLASPTYLAKALEIPQLARAPRWLIDWRVLRPMRYATAGTLLAARAALEHGLAVNLAGGYHHAAPSAGHGFCLYADAALAIALLRRENLLSNTDRILHIDLDAHQGDGVALCFRSDPTVFLFDMYNRAIFPSDPDARRRVDHDVPLSAGTNSATYLRILRAELPRFLDALSSPPPKLAIYNAGTDVLPGDPLGQLAVSYDAVLARDHFVLTQLRDRNIPTLLLPSGGYTPDSHHLIADTLTPFLTPQPAA